MGRPKEPNVITGLRNTLTAKPELEDGDQSIPADIMDRIVADRPAPQQAGPSITYGSRFRGPFITMQVNDDLIIGNRVVRQKNKHIKFENFKFTTSDPEVIAFIEALPNFGLGREYWREDDQNALTTARDAAKAIAGVRTHLQSQPIDKLRPFLSAEDFDHLAAVKESMDTHKEAVS